MAFQPINFLSAPIQRNTMLEDALSSFGNVYNAVKMPEQYAQRQKEQDLANRLKELQISGLQSQQEEAIKEAEDPLYKIKKIASALQGVIQPKQQQKPGDIQGLSQNIYAQPNAPMDLSRPNELQAAFGNMSQDDISNLMKYAIRKQLTGTAGATPEEQQAYESQKIKQAQDFQVYLQNLKAKQDLQYLAQQAKGSTDPNLKNLGAGAKEELFFRGLVSKDNPGLTEDQNYEAANVLRSGGDTLSDGTKLKPLSPAARNSLDRLTKYGTTASIITSTIGGERAEAELPVISGYIKEGNLVYPNSVAGISPQFLSDKLSATQGNKDAQDRLSKYYAAGILNFEKSQLQQMLASGKTTVQATKELMKHSATERLKDFGVSSGPVLNKTLDIVNDATEKAFKARKNVYAGASSIVNPSSSAKQETNMPPAGAKIRTWNPTTGRLE